MLWMPKVRSLELFCYRLANLKFTLDDNADDEETEQTARVKWLVHTIKLRDGRDFTRSVRDKVTDLKELERTWLKGAEADVAATATPTKTKTAAKGKKSAVGAANPSKYPGVSHHLCRRGFLLLIFQTLIDHTGDY